ncbi:alpha/beta hydrolase family protein [Paenibacillus sp. GYB003]|uniref:alpha/beta hydrolase family protein n=1 Tax=Paenibacillus sp. GYB003 TaxID=2994392 RepID=UPI002F96B59D
MNEANKELVSEHDVQRGGESLTYVLRRPEHPCSLEERLLLITVGADWKTHLLTEPYRTTADGFLANGHYALSFDIPCHGERTGPHGEGINGFRNAWLDGDDPFERFVRDAAAVIDDCIRLGFAQPGKIAVCGASRGAYMALRLLAADPRVVRAAGFAPVTDWRILSEFAPIREAAGLEALMLHRYADRLAGKPLFLAIGNRDERVGTLSCCKLYTKLADTNRKLGYPESLVEFYCTDDPGHTMGSRWYNKGTAFLLNMEGTGGGRHA